VIRTLITIHKLAKRNQSALNIANNTENLIKKYNEEMKNVKKKMIVF